MPGRLVAERGNPFIGLFGRTSDDYTLLGAGTSNKLSEACAVLGTKEVYLTFANSPLLGLYACINSFGIVLPNAISREEKEAVRRLGLNVYFYPGRHNALGNNLVANDHGCLANPQIPDEYLGKISECLNVPVRIARIHGLETVGSACTATNQGFLAHNRATEADLRLLEEVFKVKGAIGTVNLGVEYVALGLLANSRSYVAGELTTGFELMRIEQGLDLGGPGTGIRK